MKFYKVINLLNYIGKFLKKSDSQIVITILQKIFKAIFRLNKYLIEKIYH